MKILSYHPFSLYSNGGGNRILRRLYQGREKHVVSLSVLENPSKPQTGPIEEHVVYAKLLAYKWMRWYLRDCATWARHNLFRAATKRNILKAASAIQFDVVHIIQHGRFAATLCNDQFLAAKPLWVSFHDHYSTTQTTREDAAILWNRADRRLVISEEYGKEYQAQFGDKPYEIITDGVTDAEIAQPLHDAEQPYLIYFAGLLHIDYVPLFKTLADALDNLATSGLSFKLLLRGTQNIDFLNNRSFEVEYKAVTLNDAELKNELNAASVLYLPIKFTRPDFYLYSLSTKMVGYLGGGGTILYHGPEDSAASKLLKQYNAAASCNSLNADEMAQTVLSLVETGSTLSYNAKKLAEAKFNMLHLQARFWKVENSS